MRDIENKKISFSATGLMRFMGCTHVPVIDLMRLRGEGPTLEEEIVIRNLFGRKV